MPRMIQAPIVFAVLCLAVAVTWGQPVLETVSRDDLVNRIVNRIPSVQKAQENVVPIDEAKEAIDIDKSVENARKKAPPETLEEYFTKFRALQQKTIFALHRLPATILGQHKVELRAQLESASSEELLELAAAEDMTKSPTFKKYFKSYAQLILDQFAIRQRESLGLTRGWTAQITRLNSDYGIK